MKQWNYLTKILILTYNNLNIHLDPIGNLPQPDACYESVLTYSNPIPATHRGNHHFEFNSPTWCPRIQYSWTRSYDISCYRQ